MSWISPGSKLALAVVTVLSLALFSPGQEAGSSTKKPYVSTGNEAVLSGAISFAGEPQKPLEIDMSADPVCYQVNPNPRTEWLVVSDGKLSNVVCISKFLCLKATCLTYQRHRSCWSEKAAALSLTFSACEWASL